jgi:hypothetical protein
MAPNRRTLNGRWLVAGMIGFGLLLTGGLYAYWTLYTAPFQPIMQALEKKYPGSAPRVDGGKPRMDQPGESILRIVMKSPFDPSDASLADSFALEVARYVARSSDVSHFDVIEVHLFRGEPERELSQHATRVSVADLERQAARVGTQEAARDE